MLLTNYNSQLSQELREAGKIQGGYIPDKIIDSIQPVMEVNPALLRRCDILRSANRTTTGTSTLYTTPSDQDFYVVGVILSWAADAANDGTSATIACTIGGTATGRNLAHIAKITLSAIQTTVAYSLPIPVKIDRGTNITYGGAFTAGTSSIFATIIGYTVVNAKA